MKIGISLLGLKPGSMGGIEFYARKLIEHLQDLDSENDYLVFIEPGADIKLNTPNFKEVIVNPKLSDKVLTRFKRLSNGSVNVFTAIYQRENCDVVHFPFQVIDVPGISTKKIVSIMDLQHEHFPEYFNAEDLASRNSLFGRSIKEADIILSISKFTKDDIIKRHKIKADKVIVTPLGANTPSEPKPIKGYRLPEKFFYYPAASWPHKNHFRLVKAFADFIESNPGYHLVFSGSKKSEEARIGRLVNELGVDKYIHSLGFIDDHEVTYLYMKSAGIIFPSLFEGFGMPVLEAMLLKRPVACSDIPVLRELALDNVIYFNPTEPKDIENAFNQMLDSKANSTKRLRSAYSRAKLFSFKNTAKLTLEIYKNLETYEK